jgi:hypothetical protein
MDASSYGYGKQRRPRAALAWGLGLFIALQLGTAVVVENWRPELREPEYGNKKRLLARCLRDAPGRPLVLFLGTSRTDNGLCPDALPAYRTADGRCPLVFNFGLAGANPLQELLVLHRLLADGIRPTWVLVEVLPVTLQHDRDAEHLANIDFLGWRDLDVFPPLCRHPRALWRRWCRGQAVPWYTHRLSLLNWWAPAWLPWHCRQDHLWAEVESSGWMPCPSTLQSRTDFAAHVEKARQLYAPCFERFHVSPLPDRCLRKLLDDCRREGIPAALVVMPETSYFRSWFSPAFRSRINAYLEDLSRSYQVPLFDTRDWLPDEEFGDSQHLLTKGARRFTRRFGEEVLRPFLEGPPSATSSKMVIRPPGGNAGQPCKGGGEVRSPDSCSHQPGKSGPAGN